MKNLRHEELFRQVKRIAAMCALMVCYVFPSHAEKSIAYSVSYFNDSLQQYTPEQILKLSPDKFTAAETDHSPNLGYSDATLWVNIPLESGRGERILAIENAHLDYIDFYLYQGDSLINKIFSGDLRNFNTRYFNQNYFNFKIPEKATRILLATRTEGSLLVPVRIESTQDFFSRYSRFNLIHWMYLGFVILSFVTNILLFIWLKDFIYLYYALCVFGVGAVNAVDLGYTFQFLWPNHPELNEYNAAFYCVAIFIIFFVDKILQLEKNAPWLHKFFIGLYIVNVIVIVLNLLGFYSIGIQIVMMLSLLMPVIAITSGIRIYVKKKDLSSRLFLVAWSGYFIMLVVYSMAVYGVLPFNFFTANAMITGSTVEVLFLFMAVLNKIESLNSEKEELLSQQNKMLESKVLERTRELTEQKTLIEHQNQLLEDSKVHLEKLVDEKTTDLIEVNKEIVNRNNRLEQFAFVAAHNLRGPVATLLGLFNIYNKSEIKDPHNQVVMEKFLETTHKIDETIRDLARVLDLSTQKVGRKMFDNVNLLGVLENSREHLKKEIQDSNAVIESNLTSSSILVTVPLYIQNIFDSLLSNSIRYRNPEVPPRIEIQFIKENNTYHLTFTDNGSGIDVERVRDNIFQPFKRFHDEESKGLGLFVIRSQIELMGGNISVESTPGKGAAFEIFLPLL